MRWETTKNSDFERIAEECNRTCLVPIGCLESHGDHMPAGVDYLHAKAIGELAAELEPCMVFPAMFLGTSYESMVHKGAVNLRPELMVQLYFNIFDEIARNGFTKILLFSSHGGNTPFLRFLINSALNDRKPYTLFMTTNVYMLTPEQKQQITDESEGRNPTHGGEWETSLTMALTDTVDLSRVPDETVQYIPFPGDLDTANIYTGVNWSTKTPRFYVGNPTKATAERGARYIRMAAETLAGIIKNVKENTTAEQLTKAYYDRAGK